MAVVVKQPARVALANFLASVGQSGPWESKGDGHCRVYADNGCYWMPLDEVMRERRSISKWIRRNQDHSVHRWSDDMTQVGPLGLRARRKLMRRTARGIKGTS